jgi:rhodanese-related sulfurtransferase
MNGYNGDQFENEQFFKKIQFISEEKIFNELQNDKKILIFDFRKKADFDKKHLDNSINIPFDEVEFEFLQKFDTQILQSYTNDTNVKSLIPKSRRQFIAIIMHNDKISKKKILQPSKFSEEEQFHTGKILTFYKTLHLNKHREMAIFNKGFTRIEKYYSFLLNNPFLNKYFLFKIN